ncbi:MAG TPA: hypothetical protein VK957_01240, partial [Lunatimonas sp.]|nr:hypothetical protein [Lunatimonas sp.]
KEKLITISDAPITPKSKGSSNLPRIAKDKMFRRAIEKVFVIDHPKPLIDLLNNVLTQINSLGHFFFSYICNLKSFNIY